MPLIISDDESVVSNDTTIVDAPAVRIAAANVHFTNTERGRLSSSNSSVAALVLDGIGATVINDLGGVIRGLASDSYPMNGIAIRGSSGADTIRNSGLILGNISLGNGDDLFDQAGYYSTTDLIDMGDGSDVFRFAGNGDPTEWNFQIQRVIGGNGMDTLILAGRLDIITGQGVSGFERLEVSADATNIIGFSGFNEIVLESDASNNFLDSYNPNVDLTVKAFGSVTVGPNSTFRNITGTDDVEWAEVSSYFTGIGTILGSVDLRGGDDSFFFTWIAGAAPVIGGSVDGGSGRNVLHIAAVSGSTIDLSKFVNFQVLNAGSYTSAPGPSRLVNMNGYEEVQSDENTLTIADSYSPDADVVSGLLGDLVLEATTTIGNVGFYNPGQELRAQGSDLLSFSVTNAGTVLGNVWLYYGDDLYDGREGSIGGTVFGFAGNDTLYGGAGVDRLEGGFGADDLFGGAGTDVLNGGPGGDRLEGGSGIDTIDGGVGVDTAIFAGSWEAYARLNLGGGQIMVTGEEGAETLIGIERLQFEDKLIAAPSGFLGPPDMVLSAFGASTIAGGWIDFERYPRLAADVNGDGRADIVGFGDSGVQVSLATSEGGFSTPFETLHAFGAAGEAGGWASTNLYPRLAADVNGDGKADIIGFGDGGVQVALAANDGAFTAPFQALQAFGAGSGAGRWVGADLYPRAAADVNGDGMADLVGFGEGGVQVALATGGGAFAAPFLALTGFGAGSSAGNWTSADRYPRTLADINGDGMADLVGFGEGGVHVALAAGDGLFADPQLALSTFGAAPGAGGWSSNGLYPRMAADVNGDGRADLVGFGDGGVYIAVANADGSFAAPVLDLTTFGAGAAAGGWTSNTLYPRLFADVNGDGQDDILAFGDGGVYITPGSDFAIIG